jgi:hypothetical protein
MPLARVCRIFQPQLHVPLVVNLQVSPVGHGPHTLTQPGEGAVEGLHVSHVPQQVEVPLVPTQGCDPSGQRHWQPSPGIC